MIIGTCLVVRRYVADCLGPVPMHVLYVYSLLICLTRVGAQLMK
jgi:hypothetical protein